MVGKMEEEVTPLTPNLWTRTLFAYDEIVSQKTPIIMEQGIPQDGLLTDLFVTGPRKFMRLTNRNYGTVRTTFREVGPKNDPEAHQLESDLVVDLLATIISYGVQQSWGSLARTTPDNLFQVIPSVKDRFSSYNESPVNILGSRAFWGDALEGQLTQAFEEALFWDVPALDHILVFAIDAFKIGTVTQVGQSLSWVVHNPEYGLAFVLGAV